MSAHATNRPQLVKQLKISPTVTPVNMETNGWIKLHRKLRDHEIMRDHTAFVIFIYLLMTCDYKGKGFFGKYHTSQILGLPPTTFRDGIKRIVKRYDLATVRPTGKCTYYSIKKWESYQHSTDRFTDSSPTPHRPKVRIKNKEYINKQNLNFKESIIPIPSLGDAYRELLIAKKWN